MAEKEPGRGGGGSGSKVRRGRDWATGSEGVGGGVGPGENGVVTWLWY